MHVSIKQLKFEVCILPCPKSKNFTYLLNIDIDITIFCKYRIDIVSKLKKWISIQF